MLIIFTLLINLIIYMNYKSKILLFIKIKNLINHFNYIIRLLPGIANHFNNLIKLYLYINHYTIKILKM